MRIRSITATTVARIAKTALRISGRAGTALPGRLAEKIDPQLYTHLLSRYPKGVVFVCGTNGKTTTTNLTKLLLASNYTVDSNETGSNLVRGHLSTLLSSPKPSSDSLALLETDEAALVQAIGMGVRPRVIVLTNLFRDQLDRYGEIDTIARLWVAALAKLPAGSCTLVVNADDPQLVTIAKQAPHLSVRYFGIQYPELGTDIPTASIDALRDSSGKPLTYRHYYMSHLGDYVGRPAIDVAISTAIWGSSGWKIVVETSQGQITLPFEQPGIYNLYNLVAALCTADTLSVNLLNESNRLNSFKTSFARFEKIYIDHKPIWHILIKNPVALTETLRTIVGTTKLPYVLIVGSNDRAADGTDVSWYWDADTELLRANPPKQIYCFGSRSADMALRLEHSMMSGVDIVELSQEALIAALPTLNPETTYLLTTYTATLEVREALVVAGYRSASWHK